MPTDPLAFLAQYKAKPLDAIVEGVTNGSQVRARLLVSPEYHQYVNLGVAGIRAPKSGNLSGRDDNQMAEELGDESRFFVESRLLQRLVKVTLLSLPTPAPALASINGSSSPAAPQQVNLFLGTVHHPAGNIAALVVSVGLARIVDWHAGFLASSPTPTMMSELRRAELDARSHRRGLFKDLPDPRVAAQQAAASGRSFTATVTRVWGADMLSIVKEGDASAKERRVQLASVRQPRPTDPKLAGLQLEGKELLRKRLIGKPVHVTIDYVKPAEGDYEERECATVRVPGAGINVAAFLVERGLLGVLRHKQGDDNRSSDYDSLMAAEARATEDKKGLHAGKDAAPAPRIVDASESATKAAPFLSSFKRQGRIQGVVDYVASGSRFKVRLSLSSFSPSLSHGGPPLPGRARPDPDTSSLVADLDPQAGRQAHARPRLDPRPAHGPQPEREGRPVRSGGGPAREPTPAPARRRVLGRRDRQERWLYRQGASSSFHLVLVPPDRAAG